MRKIVYGFDIENLSTGLRKAQAIRKIKKYLFCRISLVFEVAWSKVITTYSLEQKKLKQCYLKKQ